MAAPKKKAASKAAVKKAPASKAAAKKAPASKAAAKKAVASKAAVKKAPASKAAAKKAPASKAPAKKAAASKAATKPTPAVVTPASFSQRFLTTQREALLEQRATYERQSRSLREEAASLVEDFQSGDVQFDEESGEGDTLNVAREQDLMMSSQALSAIEEIDHALAKFDLGTYGVCEVSGKPIPKARLEAIPWARECVEYKVGGLTSR